MGDPLIGDIFVKVLVGQQLQRLRFTVERAEQVAKTTAELCRTFYRGDSMEMQILRDFGLEAQWVADELKELRKETELWKELDESPWRGWRWWHYLFHAPTVMTLLGEDAQHLQISIKCSCGDEWVEGASA